MTAVAFSFSASGSAVKASALPRPVRVVSSRRIAPPAGVRRLSAAVSTPLYDVTCWVRGYDPLSPVPSRPTVDQAIAAMLATTGRAR